VNSSEGASLGGRVEVTPPGAAAGRGVAAIRGWIAP